MSMNPYVFLESVVITMNPFVFIDSPVMLSQPRDRAYSLRCSKLAHWREV